MKHSIKHPAPSAASVCQFAVKKYLCRVCRVPCNTSENLAEESSCFLIRGEFLLSTGSKLVPTLQGALQYLGENCDPIHKSPNRPARAGRSPAPIEGGRAIAPDYQRLWRGESVAFDLLRGYSQ